MTQHVPAPFGVLSVSFPLDEILKANTFVVAWWKWARHSAPQMLKSDKREVKWSSALLFLDKRWLYMMFFQQLNWQHIDQQQKASSHGLRLAKINPFNCGGQSNAPKSLLVGTAMYVIQQLLCRLATVMF